MTDGKWTRGPWRINGDFEIWVMAGQLHVATIPRAADGDWSPANANLIKAAPDLADCAEELVDAVRRLLVDIPYEAEDLRGTLEALRDDAEVALAKAKGETT